MAPKIFANSKYPFKKELSAKNKPINKARRQNIFNVQNPSFIAFEKAFLKKQHKPINKKKHIRLKLNLYTADTPKQFNPPPLAEGQ